MTKQSIIAAVVSLIIGLILGGAVIQVRLMSQALENHSARLTQVEGTLLQIVNLINGSRAQPQGQGQPPMQGAPVEQERMP